MSAETLKALIRPLLLLLAGGLKAHGYLHSEVSTWVDDVLPAVVAIGVVFWEMFDRQKAKEHSAAQIVTARAGSETASFAKIVEDAKDVSPAVAKAVAKQL